MILNNKAKIIFGVLGFLILTGAGGAAWYLTQQTQQSYSPTSKASSPTGTATVNLSPTSGTISDSPLTLNVSFNPAGQAISAIAVRLTYSFTGAAAPATVGAIQIASTLTTSGDWTCPVKTASANNQVMNIDISCANTSLSGFTASTNTALASFTLTAAAGTPNGTAVNLTFDPTQSIITKKSDSIDVLLTPSAQGNYTISGATSTVVHKYACNSAGNCVQNDATGTFTDSRCNNSCQIAATTHHYSCRNYSCVLDDSSTGIYTTPNCDNACLPPAPPPGTTLPQTGNPLITIGSIAIGAILFLIPFLLLKI